MNKCMFCGKLTKGSTGAAGINWTKICQSCKDGEDSALDSQIKSQAKVFDKVVELTKGAK